MCFPMSLTLSLSLWRCVFCLVFPVALYYNPINPSVVLITTFVSSSSSFSLVSSLKPRLRRMGRYLSCLTVAFLVLNFVVISWHIKQFILGFSLSKKNSDNSHLGSIKRYSYITEHSPCSEKKHPKWTYRPSVAYVMYNVCHAANITVVVYFAIKEIFLQSWIVEFFFFEVKSNNASSSNCKVNRVKKERKYCTDATSGFPDSELNWAERPDNEL
jgi:hypothetical protein